MMQELTIDNFQKEVLESALPVLVDFWSPICGPCRLLAPVLEQVAAEAGGRLRIGKVNVFEQQDLAVHYGISAVPTLLLFKGGTLVNTLVGYQDKRRPGGMDRVPREGAASAPGRVGGLRPALVRGNDPGRGGTGARRHRSDG